MDISFEGAVAHSRHAMSDPCSNYADPAISWNALSNYGYWKCTKKQYKLRTIHDLGEEAIWELC